MAQATISPKYQVVIPKEIREEVPIVVGQVLQVIAKNGVITLIPDRPLSTLRGFAKGIRTCSFGRLSPPSTVISGTPGVSGYVGTEGPTRSNTLTRKSSSSARAGLARRGFRSGWL